MRGQVADGVCGGVSPGGGGGRDPGPLERSAGAGGLRRNGGVGAVFPAGSVCGAG